MSIRVRLSFDELVPGYNKKTWFLFDTASCRIVADLEHLIQRKFEFKRNSVNLYHDGFLLPAQEKIELVRDGDIIRVEQQAHFCKDKKLAKWKDDEDTSSSKAKKQKLDGESQKSVLNSQEKKNKSNRMKNVKNQGRKSEKKPIRLSKAESNRRKRLQSDNVGKPCKGNKIAADQKAKNKVVPSEKYPCKNATVKRNRTVSSSSEPSTLPDNKSVVEKFFDDLLKKPCKVNIAQTEQNKGSLTPKRYPFKNATLPSSSSKMSSTSSSEVEILGKWNRGAKRAKIGSFSKRNEGRNASMNPGNTSSSMSSSSISDSTSSSSSCEDSSDNARNKNFKSPDKIIVSSSTSSLSSSSSSMLSSSSSSEDSSNDNQKQGLNSKTKGKCLNKNNKTKPNIHPATTASAKKQNKNVKNLSKTSNQSKKDGLDAKTKEKVMDKNTKSKTAPTLSGKEKVETARNQSNILDKETADAHLTNGNSFPSRGIVRSRNTHPPPPNINNSHIRFDSDEENGDIPAHKENLDSFTTPQSQPITPYDAGAVENINTNHAQENRLEVPSHNDINGHSLNNGKVDRNGNGRMDKRMGHATATKKTAVDYSTFLSLCGPPRVGDRIAYKVLELSASYTPEMSDYKEGTVLGYNPVKNEVFLELTDDSLTKPLGDGNISTKFELIYEDEYEENNEPRPPAIVDRKVSVLWTAMVDPRLITS